MITTCLWFPGTMAEAIAFYTGLFTDSAPGEMFHHEGNLVGGTWRMCGQQFRAINEAGQSWRFNESMSLSVDCADQAEVDRYWDALTADGGEEGMCGWCRDRFGLSWQIVPHRFVELLGDPDPARAQAATAAMLTMRKIVVSDLEAAADAAG